GSLQTDERVVGRNPIISPLLRTVDVDPQDGRQEVVNALSGAARVRRVWPRPVARRNVKKTIQSELQTTSVVAPAQPGADRRLAGRFARRGAGFGDAKSRNVRSVGDVVCHDVADEAVPVACEVGVKGQRVNLLDAGNFSCDVDRQVRLLNVRLVGKRINL